MLLPNNRSKTLKLRNLLHKRGKLINISKGENYHLLVVKLTLIVGYVSS